MVQPRKRPAAGQRIPEGLDDGSPLRLQRSRVLEPSVRRTSVPSGRGITQGVEFDYKGYLRFRGRSRINGRVGIGELGSLEPVSVASHPEV